MCVTNKVQQIPFIDIFESVLHVSGDKLAHHQEHFLTVYTAFGTTHRYCCRPVSSSIGASYQTLYIQSKSAPGDGRVCRPKHVEVILKRSINGNCCMLSVAHIVVLTTHGLTNVSSRYVRPVRFPSPPVFCLNSSLSSLHLSNTSSGSVCSYSSFCCVDNNKVSFSHAFLCNSLSIIHLYTNKIALY